MDGKHKDPAPAPAPASRLGMAWRGLVPIGVASFVALAIGGGVDVVHRHQEPGKKERSAQPAAEQDRTGPRYVVGVREAGAALVVRDVRTGHDVGLPVAAPQARRFQRVATAGDGSYVVASSAARPPHRIAFQRLRLKDDGRPEELAALPRAVVPGASSAWSDMAVSPDGDTIAYVTYGTGRTGRLDVVSARTGQRKVWTTKTPARVGSLSWAGSTLSFVWSPVRKVGGAIVHQVRALDTSGAPGDLKASRAVLTLPDGSGGAAVMSHDGRTVVAGITRNAQLTLQAYAVRTGSPTRVLWMREVVGKATRLDSDHTGGHLLVSGSDGRLYTETAQAVPAEDFLDAAW